MLLANLSGLPTLYADSREGHSPLVDWCTGHGIIILPQYLPAGDYTLLDGNAIVDRKDTTLKLYKDFASSGNRHLLRHQTMYPHVSFVFVKRERLCQIIWNILSERSL